MPDYLTSVLFLGLAVGALLVSSRFFGHPLSPFGVFYGVWFGVLSLFFVRWVEYVPVRSYTWALIALNLASFGFGWLLAHLFHNPRRIRQNARLAEYTVSTQLLRRVILAFFVLGMIGLADFLWRVDRAVGLITYLESPQEIRGAMGLGEIIEGMKLLSWLNVVNTVLCAVYLLVLRGKPRKQIWLVFVCSVVATLFMEERTRFFFAILWTGYVLAYARKWNLRRVLAGCLILGILLLAQFLAVAAWLGKVTENSPDLIAAANVHAVFYSLLQPYIYATGNFPGLQAYIDSAPESTKGLMSFYPLLRLLRLVDPTVKQPQIIGEFYAIPFDFNTYTWLQQFYTDFGVAGVLLGPWIVGLVAGLLYFHMLRVRTFYSIYANGLISFCLTLSVFVNHLTQGPAWYFLVLGFLIAKYVHRPGLALART